MTTALFPCPSRKLLLLVPIQVLVALPPQHSPQKSLPHARMAPLQMPLQLRWVASENVEENASITAAQNVIVASTSVIVRLPVSLA